MKKILFLSIAFVLFCFCGKENNDPEKQNQSEEGLKFEAVDLGLSVKWAPCNVGASKPEEYGDYYAWGETEPKNDYSWSTYKWCNGSASTFTRYCPSNAPNYWGDSESPDNKTDFWDYNCADDAARANWHGSWRTPTDAEWTELRNNCSWVWKENYNGRGINGYLVTGPSSKSIFLPSAGTRCVTDLLMAGSCGLYWSSSLNTDNPNFALILLFYDSGRVYRSESNRGNGLPVRPVCPKD